jgi:prevent-host-death family protein
LEFKRRAILCTLTSHVKSYPFEVLTPEDSFELIVLISKLCTLYLYKKKRSKTMTTIAVSELRANLMTVLEKIKHGAQIQITSHGKVVAQLIPADAVQENARAALQKLSSGACIGDVISPVEETWNAVNQ